MARRKLRIILYSVPEFGHLMPIVHIATHLAKEENHEVHLATCAFETNIQKQCEAAGVKLVGLRKDIPNPELGVGKNAELKIASKFFTLYSYYCDSVYDEMAILINEVKPDVIVTDFMCFGLMRLWKSCGIPWVMNIPGPSTVLFASQTYAPTLWSWVGAPLLGIPFSEGSMVKELHETMHYSQKSTVCLVNSFKGLETKKLPKNWLITGPPAPRATGAAKDKIQIGTDNLLNDWLQWVRSQQLKVIYVTTGTMAPLDQRIVSSLFHGLEKIAGCAILWLMKEKYQHLLPGFGNLPEKFHVRSFLPQSAALQLKDVAVVITHCGWGGMMETITAGKPIVAIPFFGDQPENSQIAKKKGFAEILTTKRLTAEEVEMKVRRVMETPTYSVKAQEIQAQLLVSGGAAGIARVLEDVANGNCQVQETCKSVGVTRRPCQSFCQPLGTIAASLCGGSQQ